MSGDPWFFWRLFTIGCLTFVLVFGVITVKAERREAMKAPAVTLVTLTNGQRVTCITVDKAITCDFLGLRTDPDYGKTKP